MAVTIRCNTCKTNDAIERPNNFLTENERTSIKQVGFVSFEKERWGCANCGRTIAQVFINQKEVKDMSGKVATKASKPSSAQKTQATSKPKTTKSENGQTQFVGYGDEIKAKCVALAKQGKTLSEIVKTVNGPKAKAVIRYCKAAGVEVAK